MIRNIIICLIVFAFPCFALAGADDKYTELRRRLIQELRSEASYAGGALGRDYFDERVLSAMAEVPRHEFVGIALKRVAYRNHPLPIGHGQTISQPFIVALMTDLLGLKADSIVLEIGTGSGYQAAVLSVLAKKVYTIEIIKDLGESAKKRLDRLGYRNVEVLVGDGYYGWKEPFKFDAIIVTCAAGHVPPPLINQLKPGGRIVIPIGGVYDVQILMVVTKDISGRISSRQSIPVRFVPMTGRAQKRE